MLNLKNIKKDYQTASETVHALKDVSIAFRKSEFVSILGPSGCGKTTLLNIVGGLDKYTDGELLINGRSTKSYTDRDWDVYRNHRIGFIFQSYNLIPHQTVLMNVELALTIAGVSKEERVARAKQALDRVGLKGQYHKRPNQLSGGQCQRVAIARALVNNPEILLADEPTGALDSVTSVQIMDLIKDISKERLVIMVTHNPELAEEYSSRIVRLIDGEIVEDSNPFSDEEEAIECALLKEKEKAKEDAENAAAEQTKTEIAAAEKSSEASDTLKKAEAKPKKKKEKAKMSFFTAFMLSLKNLFTKKGRTTLTAFAGSIGIIGIALILAVSEGMTAFIAHVQETALSSYPLTIESQTTDASSLIETFIAQGGNAGHDDDKVHKNPLISDLVKAMQEVQTSSNDLEAFKKHLDEELKKEDSELRKAVTAIQYTYDLKIPIYTKNKDGAIIKSDTSELFTKMFAKFLAGMASNGADFGGTSLESMDTSAMGSNDMMSSMIGLNMWQELITDKPDANGNCDPINPLLKEQYDLIYGSWPENYDEIILVVDQNNELDDLTLYALGLLSEDEINAIIESAVNKTELPKSEKISWSYDELVYNKETNTGLTFKTILPGAFYSQTPDGTYKDMSKTFKMNELYDNALELKVTGIIRQSEDAEVAMLTGAIGYTSGLTKYVIEQAITSDVVVAQLASPDVDVITGLPFRSTTGTNSDAKKREDFIKYAESLSDKEKLELSIQIQCLKAEIANLSSSKELAKQTLITILGKEENKDPEKLMETLTKFMEESKIELDLEGVDVSTIQDYLLNLDFETELLPLLDPYIEESCKQQIELGVRENLKDNFTDEQIIGMLDVELANTVPDTQFALYYDRLMEFSKSTYEDNLVKVGYLELDSPHRINIFASSFENKDIIASVIGDYNNGVEENQKISYTDLVGLLMSSVTTIIDAVTYVLIAFVAISLIVSSIMIGVITLISVQERTKEIGILRAIGASKRNVSAMFNAETIIIGLAAGLLGIGVSYLLCLPINLILNILTGIPNLKAILPIGGAAILVLISVVLTLISGLIPSRSAAKKDPVVALRTE